MEAITQKILDTYEITLNGKSDLIQVIKTCWKESRPLRIVTFNPEILIACEKDTSFKKAIQTANLIIPDGIGIVLLLQKLGVKSVCRQPGIELAWAALKEAISQDLSIAMLGASDRSLELSLQTIKREIGLPKLIYSRNGFFDENEEERIISLMLELKPQLLLVAMPFLRQEQLLHKAFQRGLSSVAIGIGGSLDVWAGSIDRAPLFFQRCGMEWLWRVIKQPQRISRLGSTFWPFLHLYLNAKSHK